MLVVAGSIHDDDITPFFSVMIYLKRGLEVEENGLCIARYRGYLPYVSHAPAAGCCESEHSQPAHYVALVAAAQKS